MSGEVEILGRAGRISVVGRGSEVTVAMSLQAALWALVHWRTLKLARHQGPKAVGLLGARVDFLVGPFWFASLLPSAADARLVFIPRVFGYRRDG